MKLVAFLFLVFLAAFAPGLAAADDENPQSELWARILRVRVDGKGRVAYRAIASFDQESLGRYITSLARANVDDMRRDERTAFWINAYNAGVVFGVLHGANPERLSDRARLYHWFEIDVGGTPHTLDEIANLASHHSRDPRVRIALCNGTRGAPPLRNEPYTGEDLDEQLNAAARRFVNEKPWNRVDVPNRRADLSSLFDWYRDEFERDDQTLLGFVAGFMANRKVRKILRRPEMGIAFSKFDWRLNAARGERPLRY